MTRAVKLLNSITDADRSCAGTVIVSGSHGGDYPAALASRAGAHAVIFNDAGIGLEGAGIAGVRALAECGMAAAAAACMSCWIGSAADMMECGLISFANPPATDLGIVPNMPVSEASELLRSAAGPGALLAPVKEARWEERLEGVEIPILFVDSASLVIPADEGGIIVTGSHGGLIGGDPRRALKARARLAVFNDAGIGKDETGISRLPTLDGLGIAALTVSHDSARIGNARSCIETGLVSARNACAAGLGFETRKRLQDQLRAQAPRLVGGGD